MTDLTSDRMLRLPVRMGTMEEAKVGLFIPLAGAPGMWRARIRSLLGVIYTTPAGWGQPSDGNRFGASVSGFTNEGSGTGGIGTSTEATALGIRAVFTRQGSGAWHVRLNALVWKQSRTVGGGTMPHSELFKTG